MKIEKNFAVRGPLLIQTEKRFKDDRGYFEEAFHRLDWAKEGLPTHFVQDNISSSRMGVIRGLHIQAKNPQGKLVRCLKGSIYDVCVDLREGSQTIGKYASVILDEHRGNSFYIPPGFAHGFLALEDCLISYKCTSPYDLASDGGINYADPEIGIPWHNYVYGQPIVSDKDRGLPSLGAYLERLEDGGKE